MGNRINNQADNKTHKVSQYKRMILLENKRIIISTKNNKDTLAKKYSKQMAQ